MHNIKLDTLIKFPFDHPHLATKLDSAIIHINHNKATLDKKELLPVFNAVSIVASQTPAIRFAQQSIASFKLRKGSETGLPCDIEKKQAYVLLLFLLVRFFAPKHKSV